jgi:hypothetical protein
MVSDLEAAIAAQLALLPVLALMLLASAVKVWNHR